MLEDGGDERRAASRDEAVDRLAQPHELDGRLVTRVVDQYERVVGQTRLHDPFAHHACDRGVGANRRRRPTEERGVARLQTQAERIARHVGTVLVDDRHDPERHTNLLDHQPVGPGPAFDDLPHRVGQGRHLEQARSHACDARVRQPEAIDDGRRRTLLLGVGHVGEVGLEDLGPPLDQQVGCGGEGRVLARGRREREVARRLLGPGTQRGGGRHPPRLPGDLTVRSSRFRLGQTGSSCPRHRMTRSRRRSTASSTSSHPCSSRWPGGCRPSTWRRCSATSCSRRSTWRPRSSTSMVCTPTTSCSTSSSRSGPGWRRSRNAGRSATCVAPDWWRTRSTSSSHRRPSSRSWSASTVAS